MTNNINFNSALIWSQFSTVPVFFLIKNELVPCSKVYMFELNFYLSWTIRHRFWYTQSLPYLVSNSNLPHSCMRNEEWMFEFCLVRLKYKMSWLKNKFSKSRNFANNKRWYCKIFLFVQSNQAKHTWVKHNPFPVDCNNWIDYLKNESVTVLVLPISGVKFKSAAFLYA